MWRPAHHCGLTGSVEASFPPSVCAARGTTGMVCLKNIFIYGDVHDVAKTPPESAQGLRANVTLHMIPSATRLEEGGVRNVGENVAM